MATPSLSFVGVVGLYLSINLLMTAAAALLAGSRALNRILPRPLTYKATLTIGRALATAALILPFLAAFPGTRTWSPVSAQVWAASSMRAAMIASPADARINVALNTSQVSLPLNVYKDVIWLIGIISFLVALLALFFQVRAAVLSIRNAQVLRRVRSVRILVSDRDPVPFAVWAPGRAYIVLPAMMLLRPEDVRIALQHEGQHHRQGDTVCAYFSLLGHALFGINPAFHWLTRQLSELQELACDEAVSRRPEYCGDAYCACLLRVAEDALSMREGYLRSFMAPWHVGALQRRMEAALRPTDPPHRTVTIGACLAAVSLLAAISAFTVTPVKDRRITRADAEHLLATTSGSAILGLRMNDAVLRQLNLLLGTPDGRKYLASSLTRMQTYGSAVRDALRQHGLPSQLVVVPLVESGYQNRPAGHSVGAGLWMFIRSTAMRYGLTVSDQHDERLDIGVETDAAMKLFLDLHNRFHSWPLAILAYNSGAVRVKAGIAATHSLDAWQISDAGYGNDPDYLARITAVALVISHPALLSELGS